MKKGMKTNKIKGKLKWRYIEWSHSIYPSCLKWLIFSFLLLIIVNFSNSINTELKGIITSIYTGIIASVFVTVFIQKKQDRIIFDKKKAMLFDAKFLLEEFAKNYAYLKNRESINWIDKYRICEEVSSYLSNLYKYHKDIFDVLELDYLRAINSRLFFIKRLLNVDNDEREEFMKDDEKVIEIDRKYSEAINEIVVSLFHLVIKWNFDEITNIDIMNNPSL